MSNKSKSQFGWLYSILAVVLVLAIVLVVNRIVGATGVKADLTEKGLYTLSEGTVAILGDLDTPVTVRFYATKDSDLVEPGDKELIRRIGDLLKEYRKAAPSGKFNLEFIDPEPFSEEVDDARYNGMRAFRGRNGEEIFRGITIEQLDERFAIPVIQAPSEFMLEYQISQAISRFGGGQNPVIGLMTDLPLKGYQPPQQPQQPFGQQRPQQQGSPPWGLYQELQRDYSVREFGTATAQRIGEEVKALLIVHPNSITKEVEYEIDQYVLRGGKLVVFLDSFARTSQLPPYPGASSNLPTLLPAWGWSFESSSVVVDNEFGRGLGVDDLVDPSWLVVPRSGIKDGGPVTEQLQSLELPFTGAYYPDEEKPDGVKSEVLVKSSTTSGTADPMELQNYMRQLEMAARSGGKLEKFKFEQTDSSYALCLRLTGSFKSAFPDGRPKNEPEVNSEGDAEDEEVEEEVDKDHLAESLKETAVVLVADTDMLYDQVVEPRLTQQGGQIVMAYPNSNLALAQGMIDQMAGDPNLIKVRSRGSIQRPFTTFEKMKEKAGKQKREELAKLDEQYRKLTAELSDAVKEDEKTGQKFILRSDLDKVQREREEELKKVGKKRRELDRELRRDIKWESVKIQVLNIAIVPLIVLIVGIIHLFIRRSRTSAS